jgi:beta-lactamase class A
MTAEKKGRGKGGVRQLALRLGIVASALSLVVLVAAGVFVLLDEDTPAEGEDTTATATASPTLTSTGTPVKTPTPGPATPTPTPSDPASTPDPDDVPTGGDQPSGPLPDAEGNIPENVNVSPEMLALKDQLAQTIAEYQAVTGTDTAVAVTDLVTGETISVNGNTLHKTGCVINLFALLAATKEFEAGTASPYGLEWSFKKGIGGSFPPEVKNFLEAIYGSYVTGTVKAQEYMTGWGMKTGKFDHVPYYGGEDPPPNILTALETNMILARLYRGELFNLDWTIFARQVLIDSFAYVDYILPKYLPWGATVGHKIGYHWDFDGWVNNDVGIVTFTGSDGQEKAYVISYFSQYAPSEWHGYSFGASLSADIWNFMGPRYGAAPVTYYVAPPPPPTQEPTPTPEETPQPTETSGPTPLPTPTPTPKPVPTSLFTPPPTATPTPAPNQRR